MSLMDTELIFLTSLSLPEFLLLIYVSLISSLCLPPFLSHHLFLREQGLYLTLWQSFPFHAARWLASHYSASILHLFPPHTNTCMHAHKYILVDPLHPAIRLAALLKLPRTWQIRLLWTSANLRRQIYTMYVHISGCLYVLLAYALCWLAFCHPLNSSWLSNYSW